MKKDDKIKRIRNIFNPHEEALKYMDTKRSKNTISNFKYVVKVIHGDGSVFLFENSYMECKKFNQMEMLLVYTEHCGYHAFYIDDLMGYRKY